MKEYNQTISKPEYDQQDQQDSSHDNLALVSLIMGSIGIVTTCCCCMGSVCGGLGILFAVLSRNKGRFEGYSLAGLITSITALVMGLLIGLFLTACLVTSDF